MCKKHHPESSSFSGKCGPLIYKYNLKPWQLAETGLNYAALNLHDPPKDSLVARWFNEGQLTRNIGSVYTELYGTGFSKLALPKVYDGLFFVANSSASHLNKSGQRSPVQYLLLLQILTSKKV